MPASPPACLALVVAAASFSLASCKKKEAAQQAAPAPVEPPGAFAAPFDPLPPAATDGAIGVVGKARLIATADDGSWVAVCQGQPERMRVIVGDGEGLIVDRLIAATERDLAVVDGSTLFHVDAVARASRWLGPPALANLDGVSRRLIQVDGTNVIVHDPGLAPRTIDTGAPIAWIWNRGKRWLQVAAGQQPRTVTQGYCGWLFRDDQSVPPEQRTTIDLDPSGLEAQDRVGPELGITAGGEVTLEGAVVAGADCVANVIAALAEPPRALVMCGKGRNRVVGTGGFLREVGGSVGGMGEQATISNHLFLGERVVCVTGACIDLVSGRELPTWEHPLIWRGERFVVRKKDNSLLIDALDDEHQREVVLPRVTQAITIDTATGRRTAGAAPKPPTFVDAAGRFLLYGRHVIDVEAATLVATLAEDALAIDTRGRVLVPAAEGQGPLHWRAPR